MTPALEADAVVHRVGGRDIVRGASLAADRGEVLGLVGPNGAGKSTLLGLLAGDLVPGGGTVRIAGRDVRGLGARELARMRAMLLQNTVVSFPFTVHDVVAMGRNPHTGRLGRLRPRDLEVVEAQMDRVEVNAFRDRSVTTLSGGEAARVALARVLAQEAPVVLLDEPTAALDLRHQVVVMRVARELADEGAAVVAVLHDLNLAAAHCDRIAVMAEGRVEACAPPWEALSAERVSRVFDVPVAVVPRPDGRGPLVLAELDGQAVATAMSVTTRPASSRRSAAFERWR